MKLWLDSLFFRMREFEQMEMQFCSGDEIKWYEYWKDFRNEHLSLGMGRNNYRFHEHENLAHYLCLRY